MKKPAPGTDSAALHEAIERIITETGRGGLAMAAREIGMTSSALRKRMQNPHTAFDEPTLRAAIFAIEINRQRAAPTPEPTGDTQARLSPEPASPDHQPPAQGPASDP